MGELLQTTGEMDSAPLGIILGAGDVKLWGMTARERLRRIFLRVGIRPAEGPNSAGSVVAVRGDWVYDEALISALAKRPGSALIAEDGACVAAHFQSDPGMSIQMLLKGETPPGLAPLSLAELAYNEALRKREPPVLVRLTPENVRAVEARTFAGSYKGVTDVVTKYWWPVPARIVTRWCAVAGLRPNHVTFLGFLLTLAAFWLFWQGQFGWGLVCAWIMTFLDTVDGKLARVTLTSSAIGNVFDHGIDLIHPPFWWWAWYVGCFGTAAITSDLAGVGLLVVLAGYVVQRIIEGIFMRRFGFHVHSWRPFDSFFRLITARRNPNLLILTPAWLVGYPAVGFHLVALWTALSLLVHAVQLVQAMAMPRERVVSWLSR